MPSSIKTEQILAPPFFPYDGNRIDISSYMLFPGENTDQHCHRWMYGQDCRIEEMSQSLENLPDEEHYVSKQIPSEIEIKPTHYDQKSIGVIASPQLWKSLLIRAPTKIRDEAKNASFDGMIAGTMLMYVHAMNECSIKNPDEISYEASFNNAKGACAEHFRPILSNSHLINTWTKYKPVAHLWAAYLSLNGRNLIRTDLPLLDIKLIDFVRLSQAYRKFGENFRSKHADGPLLESNSAPINIEIKINRENMYDHPEQEMPIPVHEDVVSILTSTLPEYKKKVRKKKGYEKERDQKGKPSGRKEITK